MNEYTTEHRAKLEAYLAAHDIPSGLGDEDGACTIAAINLAISGKITDTIPDCMSGVLGRATISLQDAMPEELRNSARYKALIPNMAGTGRDREMDRLAVILDWMWTAVLPQIQFVADASNCGDKWRHMCNVKTSAAASDASDAASTADVFSAAADAYNAAVYAARASARCAALASYAAAAADAADAAHCAARAVAFAAAADAAGAYATATNAEGFWSKVDPITLLERMTYITEASHD